MEVENHEHIFYRSAIEYYMSLKNTRNYTLRIHLICWIIFVIYEVLLTAYLSGNFSHLLYYILFYALNISVFYAHALIVLPKAIRSTITTLWRLPLFLIIECVFYLAIVMIFSYILELGHLRKNGLLHYDWRFFAVGLWRWVSFALYGTGYYFLLNYLNRKRAEMNKAIENEKLKRKLVQSEKDFLRTQVNPHLLFNTLNFVKFAAKSRPSEADDAIIRLSEIMRFALEQSNSESIFIKNELDQVKNIIELNQLRFDHKLKINYVEEVENEFLQIIPVVLLTLVENVFKHGMLMNPNNTAKIHISADAQKLTLFIKNQINSGSVYVSPGVGIKNIILRLNLCYPDNYIFEYGPDDEFYLVKLVIPINKKNLILTFIDD